MSGHAISRIAGT